MNDYHPSPHKIRRHCHERAGEHMLDIEHTIFTGQCAQRSDRFVRHNVLVYITTKNRFRADSYADEWYMHSELLSLPRHVLGGVIARVQPMTDIVNIRNLVGL